MKPFKRLVYYTLRIIRFLIDYSTSLIFGFVYGESKKIPPVTDHLLLESATELAQRIRKGQLKSVDVIQAYITRIKEIEPYINAVVDERFQEALQEAKAVDELIKSRKKTPEEIQNETPLLGVPFSCKEAIGVKGMSFTSGIYCRKGIKAEEDSGAAKRMRKAGAIPVVATNTAELCMWWESGNYVSGTTCNPYDTRRTAGGSSGGEGALIGAGGSVIGVGSDIAGSIRMPAFMNGVFGHKPSPGVVPNDGQCPPATEEEELFLCTGPLCRYAIDLMPTLKALTDNNPKLKLDKPVYIHQLKIYYAEDDGGNPLVTPVTPEIKNALRKVLTYFDTNHHIKPKKVTFSNLKRAYSLFGQRVGAEQKTPLIQELSKVIGKVNLPIEIIKWCLRLSKHTLPTLFIHLDCQFPHPGASKDKDLKKFDTLKTQFDELLDGPSVFLYPTHPEPAPYHNQTLPKLLNIGYTAIFNALQLPSTHVPLGLANGLPIGIQVVAAKYNDRFTIAVAKELEQEFGGWVCPGKNH